MALSIVSTPDLWTSAYRPVEWSFTSTRSPNTEPLESAAIDEIRNPTTAEIAAYPTLAATDVIIVHSTLSNVAVGDYVSVTGTDTGLYSGQYRITKVPTDTITAIDTDDAGDETGGAVTKVYRNYTLFCTVTMSNDATNPVTLRLDRDGDGVFKVDIQDIAQRTFDAPMDAVTLGAGVAMYAATGKVAQSYEISFTEGYDIPNAEGVMVFTKNPNTLYKASNYKVINSVHPYVHYDQDGTPDLEWTDGYNTSTSTKGYVVNLLSSYSVRRDLLSYAPHIDGLPFTTHDQASMRVSADDEYFLTYLQSDASDGLTMYIRQRNYNSAGSLLGTTNHTVTSPLHAGVFACGPKNITNGGGNLTGVAYYRIDIFSPSVGGGVAVSKAFVFTIDSTCDTDSQTFYWWNKLGGIDAFRVRGRISQTNTVSRSVLRRPYMPKAVNGWNARTYKTDIARGYAVESQLLTPAERMWLGDDMAESVDVRTIVGSDGKEKWARVILADGEIVADGGRKYEKGRVSLAWAYGNDNTSHRG